MQTLSAVKSLIQKDIILEWRSKYAINGIVLYVVSTVFVCYQAFKSVDPTTWNALFWIILLFASINAINKSFVQEHSGRQLYYYTIASARAVILSKIIYNMLIMLLLSSIAYLVYSVIFHNPLGDPVLYLAVVALGAIGFAAVFTMVAAISAKAGNNSTLMAILSFPLIIPMLLVLIQVSKNAMDGLDRSASYDELIALGALNIITVSVSLLLFPYLWRD